MEYAPGVRSATDSLPSTRFFVVTEGEVNIKVDNVTRTYRAGASVMSPPNTETRIANIYLKTDTHGRAQATSYALAKGLLFARRPAGRVAGCTQATAAPVLGRPLRPPW